MNGKVLPIGKLDSEVLKKIVFDKITYKRREVLTRPGIGEDCAVIDFDRYECVISTDPITAASADIGRLAIHISCNDIASNGVQPLGILLAVMLPPGTTEENIAQIMKDAARAAELAGVEIIGGHTEITPAVTTPVIVSTALGRAVKGSSASAKNMTPGDRIYMTKTAGIEGSGIIACDFAAELAGVLTKEEIEEAKGLLDFVSVVPEGLIGGEVGTSGMHDITEGGILGAVWEMCRVSGTGARIFPEAVPILPVTQKICGYYGIDCLRLISSGCMLMSVPAENTACMESRMKEAGIRFTCIGEITPEEEGIRTVCKDGRSEEIAPPSADELYKVVKR